MKKILSHPATKQVAGILATAGVAACFAFLQSIASAAGIICTPAADPVTAGGIGMGLKAGLDALRATWFHTLV